MENGTLDKPQVPFLSEQSICGHIWHNPFSVPCIIVYDFNTFNTVGLHRESYLLLLVSSTSFRIFLNGFLHRLHVTNQLSPLYSNCHAHFGHTYWCAPSILLFVNRFNTPTDLLVNIFRNRAMPSYSFHNWCGTLSIPFLTIDTHGTGTLLLHHGYAGIYHWE